MYFFFFEKSAGAEAVPGGQSPGPNKAFRLAADGKTAVKPQLAQ